MKAWVDLNTDMVYPPKKVIHPSTNRAQCLTTTLRRHQMAMKNRQFQADAVTHERKYWPNFWSIRGSSYRGLLAGEVKWSHDL